MANLSKFTKPEIFRRFAPELLAQFLNRQSPVLSARGIELPSVPTSDNMPYDRIADVFLRADETLMELYDAIHLIDRLACKNGRGAIFTVAKELKLQIPRWLSSHHDLALWVWLHHPQIAERAGYRLKMHSARAFHYFSSVLGIQTVPLQCAPQNLMDFASRMSAFYSAVSKGGGVKVFDVLENDELWLMIRHGGYLERRADVNDQTGDVSTVCFRDEEYDVLIYNLRYHELKIRNTAESSMDCMKHEFGQIFFGSIHMFVRRETFPLTVLRDAGLSFLRTVKVPGIRDVKIAEVRYFLPGAVTKIVHEKASDLLQHPGLDGGLIPRLAFSVDYTKLLFRFSGEQKYRSVELFPPNKSSFSRESDAPKVEEWLRSAGLFQGSVPSDSSENFFRLLSGHIGECCTLNGKWEGVSPIN